jgi:hypothetical protein
MIYLFTVAAPARSGTMWLSRVLTTAHSFCYHELTTHLHPYPSNIVLDDWLGQQVADSEFELAQRRWVLQCYPDYFARLWERAIYGQFIVGNSDHFTLQFLPGLWLLWPNMRFVFSVRNGISVVQSRLAHKLETPPVAVSEWRKRWGDEEFFGLCCHAWVAEAEQMAKAKDWLDGRAAAIETTFEKITTDLGELERVWDWLGIGKWEEYKDRNAEMLRTPVNARTNAERVVSSEEIWSAWDSAQRATFRKVCGVTMKRLRYPLLD